MCMNSTYVPNTKLGVVDDVVSHGELDLVLRWIYGHDLLDDAALWSQKLTVVLRHIGQDRHHKGISTFHLPQALSQSNHSFHIVTISGQERHVTLPRLLFTGAGENIGRWYLWRSHFQVCVCVESKAMERNYEAANLTPLAFCFWAKWARFQRFK